VSTDDPDYSHIEETYNEGSGDYSDYFKQPHAFIEPDGKNSFIACLPDPKFLIAAVDPGWILSNSSNWATTLPPSIFPIASSISPDLAFPVLRSKKWT